MTSISIDFTYQSILIGELNNRLISMISIDFRYRFLSINDVWHVGQVYTKPKSFKLWSGPHGRLYLGTDHDNTPSGGGGGGLPYISLIGTAPKGMVFAPFCSENRYRLYPFWSGVGHGFRGNHGSVWRYLSFQFQMSKNSKWIKKSFLLAFCCSSNQSNDDIIS